MSVPGLHLYPGEQQHWFADLGAEDLIRIAQYEDKLGYDVLVAGEHIVMRDDWVGVMGPRWTPARREPTSTSIPTRARSIRRHSKPRSN